MTLDNPVSGFNYQPPHRLIVKARSPTGTRKGYFWEIVRDNQAQGVIQRSSESYRSMEEAYEFGAVILSQTLAKSLTRTPNVGLRSRHLSPHLP